MLKNILIYLIVFLFIIIILFDKEITTLYNKPNKEEFEQITYNEKNFEMDEKSIIMSINTNLTKDECFNKVNKRDINGATYNLENNLCKLYFFAKKGIQKLNVESII
jgi:hypothetical protein